MPVSAGRPRHPFYQAVEFPQTRTCIQSERKKNSASSCGILVLTRPYPNIGSCKTVALILGRTRAYALHRLGRFFPVSQPCRNARLSLPKHASPWSTAATLARPAPPRVRERTVGEIKPNRIERGNRGPCMILTDKPADFAADRSNGNCKTLHNFLG